MERKSIQKERKSLLPIHRIRRHGQPKPYREQNTVHKMKPNRIVLCRLDCMRFVMVGADKVCELDGMGDSQERQVKWSSGHHAAAIQNAVHEHESGE